jgi:hypothetical protein
MVGGGTIVEGVKVEYIVGRRPMKMIHDPRQRTITTLD